MQAFVQHTGLVAALNRVNVDTDQMIPKQFLKALDAPGFRPRPLLRLAIFARRKTESGI